MPNACCLVPYSSDNGTFIYLNSQENKMATPPPVTDTLARFVAETAYSTISEKTITNAKMHILDILGVALAAVATPVAAIALDYCARVSNSNEASIWGTPAKSSVPWQHSPMAFWPTLSISTTG